ncbi:unnamed protein product [Dovyalis caffra]|uniref:Uncharacterized protein n=1 Tax=Dovyalis caffra TaxID=77055 RepID=A0AAV1QYU4_9ROSI|nr:unnamed protein product [Dovyalis caffra]
MGSQILLLSWVGRERDLTKARKNSYVLTGKQFSSYSRTYIWQLVHFPDRAWLQSGDAKTILIAFTKKAEHVAPSPFRWRKHHHKYLFLANA